MPWNDIWKYVLSSAGGGVAVAVLLRLFVDKWMDKHFASELEKLKYEHQKALENVKHTIQSTFSRIVKVHEKEYEVLPKAWFLLHVAIGSACMTASGMKERPDFLNMPDGEL